MKRLSLIGFLCVLMTLPVAAMADLSEVAWLTDSELDALEGQAGVTIEIGSLASPVTVTQTVDGISWYDADGEDPPGGANDPAALIINAAGGTASMAATVYGDLLLDVDEVEGIVLNMSGLTINNTVTLTDVIVGINDGTDFVLDDAAGEVLGQLSLNNLTTTLTLPDRIAVSPH